MKKGTSKKLQLNRETLKQLDESRLGQAAVGGTSLPHSDVPTYDCTQGCTSFHTC